MWTLEEAIAYYEKQGAPRDQNALGNLLREIARENGGVPAYMLQQVADAYGVKQSFLLAVMKRLPSLRLQDTHELRLCAGPNCGKHTALAAKALTLEKAYPGRFVLKFTPCMRLCGKGPNVVFDGKPYYRATEELLESLVKGLDRE